MQQNWFWQLIGWPIGNLGLSVVSGKKFPTTCNSSTANSLSKESARWGKLPSLSICPDIISLYLILCFLYIFSYIIFLIWIETLFDDFLITQIVLISIGIEPKGDWGRWRAGGPGLESRQFLEIELTVTAGIIITPGENRAGDFPWHFQRKRHS